MRPRSVGKRRLRKQPRKHRFQATAPAFRVRVPESARQRQRRNRQRFPAVKQFTRRFVLSARWISLALLLVAAGALALIGIDDSFRLTYIPVEGAFASTPAEIVEASELAGAHVFGVDPQAAAAGIAEMPGIISATVTLGWPNEVMILVSEPQPVAMWLEEGEEYWITAEGDLIDARNHPAGLLLIESEDSPQALSTFAPAEAARPAASTADEEAALEDISVDETTIDESEGGEPTDTGFVAKDILAGALQLRRLRPNIDKLLYRPAGGLSYQDGRGWRVYFGVGTNMDQKLVVYETIVDDLLARGLSPAYISVSNQSKPYYRTN